MMNKLPFLFYKFLLILIRAANKVKEKQSENLKMPFVFEYNYKRDVRELDINFKSNETFMHCLTQRSMKINMDVPSDF